MKNKVKCFTEFIYFLFLPWKAFPLWISWVSIEPAQKCHHHLGLQCPEFHYTFTGSFQAGLGQRQGPHRHQVLGIWLKLAKGAWSTFLLQGKLTWMRLNPPSCHQTWLWYCGSYTKNGKSAVGAWALSWLEMLSPGWISLLPRRAPLKCHLSRKAFPGPPF